MRYLMTGAGGFIGRFVARKLAADHSLVLVGRNPVSLSNNEQFLRWDMSGSEGFSFPEDIDAVVHLAQSDQYRKGAEGALDMARVNALATAELLAQAHQARVKRFCLISTGTVYEPFREPIVEDASLSPESFLGATKLAAEMLALPYRSLMSISTLRLFFPYGPGQLARLIPDLIGRVKNSVPISLGGEGDGGKIVPTYVDDIADVISSALHDQWTGTYNVSSPKSVSIREIGEKIGVLLGKRPIFEQQPERQPLTVIPDLRRLESVYPLNRLTSLEDGLRKVLAE